MKRVMILLLCASIMLSIIPAYAFPGYTDDTEETVNGFASAYGWNTENVDAPTWQGTEEPDQEYGRLQGHQKENYEDLIIADEWQAFELGLIDSVSSKHGGSGAQQMIEVALGELGHVDGAVGLHDGLGPLEAVVSVVVPVIFQHPDLAGLSEAVTVLETSCVFDFRDVPSTSSEG